MKFNYTNKKPTVLIDLLDLEIGVTYNIKPYPQDGYILTRIKRVSTLEYHANANLTVSIHSYGRTSEELNSDLRGKVIVELA